MSKKFNSTVLPGGVIVGDFPKPPEWRVKNMLVRESIGVLSGTYGSAKTFVAVDLAVAVSTGTMFAGFDVVDNCAVIYYAERYAQAKRRLAVAGGRKKIPVWLTGTIPKLSDKGSEDEIIDAVQEIDEHMRAEFGLPVGVVIIDTLITAAGWTDEQSNAQAQVVMNKMRRISAETHTMVLAVDHFGHNGKHTRGASDKEASADFVLHTENKSDTAFSMTLRKVSDGPQGKVLHLHLENVVVGENKDGEPWGEGVVRWVDAPAPTSDVLLDAMRDAKKSKVGGRAVVEIKEVRELFYAAIKKGKSDINQEALRQRFLRARADVEVVEGKYLVIPKA